MDGSTSIAAAMECKHLGVSEEEKTWIKSREVRSGPVANTPTIDDPNANPFLRKLNSTVNRAKEQVNSTGLTDNKFIFMKISSDTPFWGMPDVKAGMTELVQRIEGKLREEGIELVAFEGYRPEQRFGTS